MDFHSPRLITTNLGKKKIRQQNNFNSIQL